MNKREFTSLLKEQTRQALEREQALLEQIERQSVQINQLSYQLEQQAANIKDLTAIIESMGESLRLRDSNIEMPVERIIHYFTEGGFELCKPTAHGLIHKAALMMERFEAVLRKVIESDKYPDAIEQLIRFISISRRNSLFCEHHNPEITWIDCEGNLVLSSLNVSKNAKLVSLSAYNLKEITSLDVSNNPKLWQLSCHFSPKLTTLYLKTGQQSTIKTLNKDAHTEIAYN